MTKLILVRHAPTIHEPNTISTDWQLSSESEMLCKQLAEKIRDYQPIMVYTSHETKAIQTGQFIASQLNELQLLQHDGLEETIRKSKVFYDNQNDFRNAVRQAMEKPTELLFGDETFADAKLRLQHAIEEIVDRHGKKTLILVSHGRVLAMYLSEIMHTSPVTIWEKLKMPAYAVLSWDEQIIEKIEYEIKTLS